MKSVMRFVVVLTAIAMIGAGGYVASPALRAKAQQCYAEWTGWDDAARAADPVRYVSHVQERLRRDLEQLSSARQELSGEIGQLVLKEREQRALREHAQQLAEEFRSEYQACCFPIEVRGAAYTEAEVVSQVSSLLAEAKGYEAAIETLRNVRERAESEREELTVRINRTKVDLVALSTKKTLIRENTITEEGRQMLAQVDQLLDGNRTVIEGNPVRSVPELLTAQTVDGGTRRNEIAARRFLNGDRPTNGRREPDGAGGESQVSVRGKSEVPQIVSVSQF